jgi:Na+/melibiose symporter-like transporter
VDRDDDLQRGVMSAFRNRYGSSPLHLLGHLAAFAVAVWAVGQILDGGTVVNWIAWFFGAALLHDLVLLPFYSLLDRILGLSARHGSRRRAALRNHVRAPAAISGVLLLVYFPLILGLSSTNYRNDTGHSLSGYTRNWLLITAGLFVASALVYAVRATIASREHPDA